MRMERRVDERGVLQRRGRGRGRHVGVRQRMVPQLCRGAGEERSA